MRAYLDTVASWVRLVWEAWLVVVRFFSWVVSYLVAVVLFVVGFVPYGLVLRVISFDPLSREVDDETDSYWSDHHARNGSLKDFKKQY